MARLQKTWGLPFTLSVISSLLFSSVIINDPR
jgi:hypothetical protein